MYKVALWGLGEGYNMFVSHHGFEMVEVVAVADSLARLYHTIDQIPVVAPVELSNGSIEYDYLIITVINEDTFKEIVRQAVSMGIKREIILPLRIFQISYFDFNKYIKIKESNISILSDNCFAGFLYHYFGLKFLTPTINMYCDHEAYYSFLENLQENMTRQMEKVEDYAETPFLGRFMFPRGRVGKVEWQFNHDVEFETAAARWKRGCERFNWNNYLTIMTIRSDEMAYKFDALPIEHKIGFYWKDLGLKSVVYIPEWNDPAIRAKFGYDFSTIVNRAASERNGIRPVNWMKALLHEKDYRRVQAITYDAERDLDVHKF